MQLFLHFRMVALFHTVKKPYLFFFLILFFFGYLGGAQHVALVLDATVVKILIDRLMALKGSQKTLLYLLQLLFLFFHRGRFSMHASVNEPASLTVSDSVLL